MPDTAEPSPHYPPPPVQPTWPTLAYLKLFTLFSLLHHTWRSLLHRFLPTPLKPSQFRPHAPSKTTSTAILVTGCSTGLGYATVMDLLGQGYAVFATVRRREDVNRLMEGCGKNHGLIPVLLDVTDKKGVGEAVEMVRRVCEQRGMELGGLVLNAGVATFVPMELQTMESVEKTMNVNCIAVYAMIQAFLPLLRPSQGRILIVGSVNGSVGVPGMAAYSMSKFALEGLVDSLRAELQPQHIPVILLKPGTFQTEIFQKVEAERPPIRTNLPTPLEPHYQSLLTVLNEAPRLQYKRGSHPILFTQCVLHALQTPFPAERYWIGVDAWAIRLGRGLAPDWVFDGVVRVLFGVQQWYIDRYVRKTV